MKITDPSDYLFLGNLIRYLLHVQPGRRLDGGGYVLEAMKNVGILLTRNGFPVSNKMFENTLGELRAKFVKQIKESGSPEKEIISKNDAEDLGHKMKSLEDAIFAEVAICRIAVPVTRRYELKYLIDDPTGLFASGSFAMLPQVAQYDVRQGCRAIAFDLPTAAAFHLLRAVEECQRWLHRAHFPQADCSTMAWGPVWQALYGKVRRPRPDPVLMAHLDHLRKRFRNPTDHPEKVFEIDEAQDLLNICIDAIGRVVQDSRVRSRGDKAK